MRVLLFAVLLMLAPGCARQSPPMLAGGKPVSYWRDALQRNPVPKVRQAAAAKLGNVGPSDPTAMPALMRALQDRDAGVRCAAIVALLKFGTDAEQVIPTIRQLGQNDRDARVRNCARKALAKLLSMR